MTASIEQPWHTLFAQKQRLDKQGFSIAKACRDEMRFTRYTLEQVGCLLDFSKQYVDDEALEALIQFAENKDLDQKIQLFLRGQYLNLTESRAVLHPVLRDHSDAPLHFAGEDIKREVKQVQDKMKHFVKDCYAGRKTGQQGQAFTDCICLGIGGSYLGPHLVTEALAPFSSKQAIRLHFIANVDSETLERTLAQLNPAQTLCIISSKTFATQETLANAKKVKDWLISAMGNKAPATHLLGITAASDKALAFGLSDEHIFPFWDWVGGRFSVWSAIGLPIMLHLGVSVFEDFIAGAYEMDQHFQTQPLRQNMPVIMGLLGIWNINVLGYQTQAILPYADALARLPAYCQQLEMESNGKHRNWRGERVTYQTAPVIWGDVGCNGQHAYMQLLHQGTQIVPADFIIPIRARAIAQDLQQTLVANALGQSQALMEGQAHEHEWFRHCDGNRPSSTLMFPELTPKMLGRLLALYEHKVFVQGVIWEINSFDQFGVELGKTLSNRLLPALLSLNTTADKAVAFTESLDASTRGLLGFYRRHYQQGSGEDNGTTSSLGDGGNRRDRDSDLS